ncbi:MAG: bifunctional phosphopantothenoylcysteine decarboxylase/phosphopantothenate--cysteine ligase CoaBC [Chloroflexota bacterium]|nr:bifunctional phosphopantothenoylcysteine decarboxylase/phosphopantothenate--cysteine ligase CoaBC [Chloroflexota bacterium]
MARLLRGRSIILGITGSIAAYKAVELASRLVKAGASVDVVMTEAATKFVTPLTFQAITRRPVVTEMFALLHQAEIAHVSLAQRADVLVIAPATANTIAKLASGLADNMLSAIALATCAPLVIAPAMDAGMYENPLTQKNLARLRERGATIVGPARGRLASGEVGWGRMAEPEEIFEAVRLVLGQEGALAGRKVVVTAGGTREPIDPVRFIGNRSSGRMGYRLAEAARDLGAEVALISASTTLPRPAGVEFIPVETAQEMCEAVLEAITEADVLLMAAAVADYRPRTAAEQKIKKGMGMTLELVRTPDILIQIARDSLLKVGFAAETEEIVENARAKLVEKGLDLVVANDARLTMGSEESQVTLIDRAGRVEELPLLAKEEVAEKVMERVVELLEGDASARRGC